MSREEVPSNPGLTECLIELEGPRGKTYDAFNLGDSRVDVPLDPIPFGAWQEFPIGDALKFPIPRT